MLKLSLIAELIFLVVVVHAQSPHGKSLKIDCSKCHTAENWTMDRAKATFDHGTTNFALKGQHNKINCANCHKSLVFSEAKSECSDCHTDMHQQTVGLDCARCHNTNSWVVTNITQIHQESRFPLMGAHKSAECAACHKSASNLQFTNLGVECFDCHKQDYYATTEPNHEQAGYSINCFECHSIRELEWNATLFSHDQFPLVQGHSTPTCTDCHGEPPFEKTESSCYSCHEYDYSTTQSPNHQALGFSTECTTCHTLSPGWQPAKYANHDAENFPIFSGKHKGQWNSCAKCHTNANDYSVFTCVDCHEHGQLLMYATHSGRKDYKWESSSCLSCHPRGRSED
jgi:Zn finger protein HypA/HybF involved in hydrogenase expression